MINKDKMFADIKSEEEAVKIQQELNKYITFDSKIELDDIKTVAGVDLAYWGKDGEEYGVCCISVIDYKTKELIENVEYSGKIEFPYIAGCLAFREMPLILKTVEKLSVDPDIYVFDGNGYMHPRHMGIATHAAIYLNKPSIGVAKSYYKIGNTDFIMPENKEGAYTNIVIEGDVYGRALRTHEDVKPIFLSAGNYIDLETATEIINSLIIKDSHIPIPTRLADVETHRMRSVYKSKI